MSYNGVVSGRVVSPTEPTMPARAYSPDFPLRGPQTRKSPHENHTFSSDIPIRGGRSSGGAPEGPLTPSYVNNPVTFPEASSAQIETYSAELDPRSRTSSQEYNNSFAPSPPRHTFQNPELSLSHPDRVSSPRIVVPEDDGSVSRTGSDEHAAQPSEMSQGLQYHHQRNVSDGSRQNNLDGPMARTNNQRLGTPQSLLNANSARPMSTYSDGGSRGRDFSPNLSPNGQVRSASSQGRRTPDARPLSYVDLLSLPYSQQAPPNVNFDHSHLQGAVGANASLLSTKKTLEMYRANVKKTNDPAIQYSFAIFMLDTAQETMRVLSQGDGQTEQAVTSPSELVAEARSILQRLADRSYPFAQYYLADGYASGVFAKGKEDNDKAFPLFVAASKHGHAEAGYRAALCYEFGWGTRKDPLKAVQFYKQSASKNHPGAMVRLGRASLTGDLGLGSQYRQGVKWLKRATESADFQYNSAPYDLGLLHETGYGDDIFRDETYAAQLFTQSADLGHPEASFRLGDAYEHGKLNCPKDPALSVHFYNGAASRGHPQAMMALCAWYMVGAEPVLDKDENEAYEWAKKAAEHGLPKAQYAVGYFTEMGIGCRRDPLEANVWYVRAADQGDERAKHRIAAIQAAASGGASAGNSVTPQKGKKGRGSPDQKDGSKSKKWGIF